MKITNVRTVQLSRPLDRPQRNARGSRDQRRFTFVLVETDRGLTGIGDAFGDQAIVEPILAKRLGPMAVGLDPTDIAAVWIKLFASRAFWEIGGSVLCGISAIEVACWDIRGQAEGGAGLCVARRFEARPHRGLRLRLDQRSGIGQGRKEEMRSISHARHGWGGAC